MKINLEGVKGIFSEEQIKILKDTFKQLEKEYENFHFQEEVKEDEVLFDYSLRKGRATSRNAIRLLHVMGYPDAVIEKAEERAEHFLETGNWT